MGVLLFLISGILLGVNSCENTMECDNCLKLNCQFVITRNYSFFCLSDYQKIGNLKMVVNDGKSCTAAKKLLERK